MRAIVARTRWLSVAGLIALSGCDSLFGGPDPKISVTPSTTTVNLAQGASSIVTLTISRSHYDKNITLSVEGDGAGVTALVSPTVIANNVTSVNLTVSASGSAAPGDYTVTVRASGDGVEEQTVSLDVTVTVTGSFSLGVLDPLTVAQGGTSTATALVQRFQGNASNVTLAASGVPSGVTLTIESTPTTSSSTRMSAAATAGAAPGTYTITLTASAAGFANQTATFSLVVIAPPTTAAVSIPFCPNDLPTWFAYRNEGYSWQRVTPTGSSFNFDATDRVSVAYVFLGSESSIQIISSSRAELVAGTSGDCDGSKSLTGSASGVSTGQTAFVNIGAATVQLTPATAPNFTVPGVANGAKDLVAVRGAFLGATDFFHPDAIVIRRSLNLANGAAIDPIDFAGAEAVAPATNTVTVSGLLAGDQSTLQNTFWSTTSTYATLQSDDASTGSLTLYSVPAAKIVAGDLHELYLDAFSQTSTVLAGHSFVTYYSTGSDRSESVGPSLSTPTLNTVTVTPYARVRGRLTSQAQYNTSAQFGYFQSPNSGSDRLVTVVLTAAYLGGTPATWEITAPDLSGVPGFDTNWMLIGGEPTGFYAEAFSGRTELLFGAPPVNSDLVRFAYRVGSIFTTQLRADSPVADARRWARWTRPSFRQYLRR